MTRGRTTNWAEVVDRLDGSAEAKARLTTILEALAGQRTLAEAAARLGLGERRLHELRNRALQAAVGGLEPLRAGRPAGAAPEAEARVAALEATIGELRVELRAAQVREEIALVMPHVVRGQGTKKVARGKARPGQHGAP